MKKLKTFFQNVMYLLNHSLPKEVNASPIISGESLLGALPAKETKSILTIEYINKSIEGSRSSEHTRIVSMDGKQIYSYTAPSSIVTKDNSIFRQLELWLVDYERSQPG